MKGPLAKEYDVSFRVNPSHLHGDLNRDGKIDVAVLVKQRSTRKLGIAIINGATDKVTILGAGVGIGNGGDDFKWMDYCRFIRKTGWRWKPVRRRLRGVTVTRYSWAKAKQPAH